MNLHNNKDFIAAIRPFDRLSEAELERVSAALDIHYLPQGLEVIKSGDSCDVLYILFKGMVRQEDAEGVVGILGPAEFFDTDALISGTSHHDYTVTEEALCYALPRTLFLDIARGNPPFQDYFFQNLSQKIEELREMSGCGDLNPLVTGRVKEITPRPLLPMAGDAPIRQAASTMKNHKADALLVHVGEGSFAMVTSTLIRDAVADEGFDPQWPVAQIARHPMVTIANDDLLFNAILMMTRHQVSRLLVEKNGEPQGFLELVDLLSYLSNHSHLVVSQISRATSLDALRDAAARLPFTVRNLAAKGVKMRYVARLMREMNRHLFLKLYTMLAPPEIAANTALVVMGSEGRGEQLLKTDQDNALLLRDGFDHPDLFSFRQELESAMVTLGFPPCPGGIMLTGETWCAPVSRFQERVRGWIEDGEPDTLMQLAIFYDATTVAGDERLLQQVRKYLLSRLPDSPSFYARFAQPTTVFDTPLGLFSQFVLESQGEAEGLDIKKGGLFPIVHGIRSLALENRLREVNTAKRIRALTRLGVFDSSFANDLIEAFDFMSGIRLQRMLESNAAPGQEDNTMIDPTRLSTWQRELLKDSLRTVNRLKKLVVHHFRLNLLG